MEKGSYEYKQGVNRVEVGAWEEKHFHFIILFIEIACFLFDNSPLNKGERHARATNKLGETKKSPLPTFSEVISTNFLFEVDFWILKLPSVHQYMGGFNLDRI